MRGIKIMEQPKYRFEDLHLQSDKNYTDINDTIVGFLFDRDIIVPSDIQIRLEDIINNMLAEHFAETQQVLYPSDFEASISMEMDTRTNKVIISTYIVNADDLNLHTEIDTDTLHDYGRTKKYFFNELGCIVLNRIGQLQKAAKVKGWLALWHYNMEEIGYIMIDTNIESLAIKAEIKQRLRNEMENSISEDDMKFLLKTFDDVSSRYRFSRKSR